MLGRKKNSYVSAVPTGWNFFSAHLGAWEIHYSIFSFHTQIPLLFSALFTLTPAWLNSEVEISGKRNTQSPSISFWQHRIIGKTFFLCLWYDQINVSNTNDGVVSQKKSNPGRPGEIFFGHPQRRKHSYFFRPNVLCDVLCMHISYLLNLKGVGVYLFAVFALFWRGLSVFRNFFVRILRFFGF